MTNPTKKRKKYGEDDDEEYIDVPEPKKKKTPKTTKKPLTKSKKATVKAAAKAPVKVAVPVMYLTPVPVNLAPYEIIVAVAYTMFADPGDAPGGQGDYMGCQQMTITIGPKQQFGDAGTNASSTHPRALAAARAAHVNRTFKSGHVLNADFGGPDAARNMTILTSSANTRQTKFDSNVKRARNALYNVYKAIGSCGPNDPAFFDTIGYGISVDIQMGGGTWGAAYPDNCISRQMDLVATVVNDGPIRAAALIPANFSSPRPSVLNSIDHLCDVVQDYVDIAMTRTQIDNT